jgi:hypothetical protein
MRKFCIVGALLFVVASAQAQIVPLPKALSEGIYKFAGRCTQLTVLKYQFPYQCENFMGITTSDPSKPIFVFALTGGKTWLYFASGPAAISPGRMVFPVAKMIDSVVQRKYVYPGECVVSGMLDAVTVHCTMWRDDSHQEITRQIEFVGSGSWAFSKGTSP